MTCGAAASLTIVLNALVNNGDEIITFAPFFPEYRIFAENAGAKLVAVDCVEDTFKIDFEKFESAITAHTKGVIVNSPNNPSGVVYTEEEIKKWLKRFYTRFFAQQFKRSCLPDGVKVGSVALSPRGDWRMPSDAQADLWLAELDNL